MEYWRWHGLLQARTVDEPSCWGGWQRYGLVGLREVWMPKWSACQREEEEEDEEERQRQQRGRKMEEEEESGRKKQ